ncbi:MAG: EAL domain-containing protein [Chromatiales bacterium]|nr:EAL domain-containing protein [Chromatiales bacterium]
MTESWLIAALLALTVALGTACVLLWRSRSALARSVAVFNRAIFTAEKNARFGERLPVPEGGRELTELGHTVNRLFDVLAAREAEMQRCEAMFRELADTLPEVVLVHRERIIFASQAAAALLGVAADKLVGRPVTDLVRPAYRGLLGKQVSARLSGGGEPERIELQLLSGNDEEVWAEADSSVIEYQGERALLTVARDITLRKDIAQTLGRSKQQAQVTLESIGEGVFTTDTQGRIDYLNAAAEQLIGVTREQAVGKRLGDMVRLLDETDQRELGDPVSRSLAERRRVSLGRRAMMATDDGERELSIELTASPITGADGQLAGAVVIMHDVTEIRGLARRMSYQAAHDALTGLINRAEFERRLDQALDQVRESRTSHVVCYMDLDRFKAVNDTCGHMAGDSMLRELAGIIREKVRDSDSVARLGGDEFCMLLIGCPLDKARQIADDVCAAVRDYRFTWQDKIFSVGISIGLVEVGRESGTIKDILSAADSACYIAKQQGRGRVHVYSARDEVRARQRGDIHWLRQLQTALREDRFELHVQPIIALRAGVRSGPAAEVLLRLLDEQGRAVLPRQFFKSAERYQLMPAIDRWVVRSALTAIANGGIRLPDERSCTINLSGQSMVEESFLEFVVDVLDHSQIPPSRICFEVSENAVISGFEQARRFIGVLHGIGCQFCMDDFGSGFGSFTSIRDLSMDYLKVDGAYTRDLKPDSPNYQVVSAIISLGRTVGFRVIAEQVEQQADFEALREMGVDYIQGNFVARAQRLGD